VDEWTVTHADDTVERFNALGLMISSANRDGQTNSYTYATGTANLIQVLHFSGRAISIEYDGNNRVSKMTDPDAYQYRYEYNANGMLEYVIYPDSTPIDPNDNPKLRYHYEDPNHNDLVTGVTDELGVRYATYGYDADRNAILSELAGSVDATNVTYNPDGTVSVTNALGKQNNYTFDINNGSRKLSSVDGVPTPMCGATTSAITYDANGFMDTRTDEEGNVTDYTYNARGLVEVMIEAQGTPEEVTTTTTWHSTLRVPTQIVRPGQTETMTYDSSGRVLTRTLTDTQTQSSPYTTTGNTRVTSYTYNALGLVETIDGPRTDVVDVTNYAYDANGDLKTTTNAAGHVTEIVSRNARGLPTAVEDANNLRTELNYDPRGRLTSRVVKSDQGDVVTSMTYDAAGQLVRTDLPTGGHIRYEYDDAHRLVAIENDLEERIEYVLDDAGNATSTNHSGPTGTLLQTQDQVFDELSRLRIWVDGVNNSTNYAYDDNGNLTSTTDPLTRTSSQTFDALDRTKTATDAASGVTSYGYDDRGNLLSVTDPRGVVTTYVYDGLDNLIHEISADAGATTYHYDAAGNMTQSIDARGVVANYTYDLLNRMLTTTYPGSTSENITYTYDVGAEGISRLRGFTDESGSTR